MVAGVTSPAMPVVLLHRQATCAPLRARARPQGPLAVTASGASPGARGCAVLRPGSRRWLGVAARGGLASSCSLGWAEFPGAADEARIVRPISNRVHEARSICSPDPINLSSKERGETICAGASSRAAVLPGICPRPGKASLLRRHRRKPPASTPAPRQGKPAAPTPTQASRFDTRLIPSRPRRRQGGRDAAPPQQPSGTRRPAPASARGACCSRSRSSSRPPSPSSSTGVRSCQVCGI